MGEGDEDGEGGVELPEGEAGGQQEEEGSERQPGGRERGREGGVSG